MAERATVVGGGLAGMAAALRLAERGYDVGLYEASDRLGGKAGSHYIQGRWVDHGYHVFMAWYRNTWSLVDELGIQDRFRRGKHFYEVLPIAAGATSADANDLARRTKRLRVLNRNLITAVDLISRPAWYLHDLDLEAFIRSRMYNGPTKAQRLREISRKALGAQAFDVSALTMRNNLRTWATVVRDQNWNALRGPLQTELVDPLRNLLEKNSVEIHMGRRLVGATIADYKVTALRFDGAAEPMDVASHRIVLALPVEVVQQLARSDRSLVQAVYECDPRLLRVEYLRGRPLAAMDLHFRQGVRIRGMPAQHVLLRDSQFDLSALDISQLWDDYKGEDATVLQVVAGDTTTLTGLSGHDFATPILAELQRYLPFSLADLELVAPLPNRDVPLFVNEVGSERHRPRPETQIENLFLAGDWVSTDVDLACMEGAISSGLQAADAITRADGRERVTVLPMQHGPIWLFKILRYPLALVTWPMKALDLGREIVRDRRPPEPSRPPMEAVCAVEDLPAPALAELSPPSLGSSHPAGGGGSP
jgi:uncharacterized protein with NAD-binding domain and iron-sulfur cluster